jgi:hypothetical protein
MHLGSGLRLINNMLQALAAASGGRALGQRQDHHNDRMMPPGPPLSLAPAPARLLRSSSESS